MSGDDKKYIDPELEKFLKENREMLERLFKEESEMMEKFLKEGTDSFRETFDRERRKAEEFAGGKKEDVKEKAEEVFNAFTDPEVQKHFMVMGMEFMMGMNALVRAMPFPDFVKEAAGRTEEAGKNASGEVLRSKKSKPKAEPERIDIEMIPKDDGPGKKEESD